MADEAVLVMVARVASPGALGAASCTGIAVSSCTSTAVGEAPEATEWEEGLMAKRSMVAGSARTDVRRLTIPPLSSSSQGKSAHAEQAEAASSGCV
jgi:hypothetical protein